MLAFLVRPAEFTLHEYDTDERVVENDSILEHGIYVVKPIREDGEPSGIYFSTNVSSSAVHHR